MTESGLGRTPAEYILFLYQENLSVTQSNSSVTERPFTVTLNPAYAEAVKQPAWTGWEKEVITMTFGEKLREARKAAGLSQEQFAEKLSVSRSAVAKWETDKGMPDVNNLKTLAQLLDVSLDYLLDEDEKLSFNETKEAIRKTKLYKSYKMSFWGWSNFKLAVVEVGNGNEMENQTEKHGIYYNRFGKDYQ